MARGITEQDVWKAADALLLEGGRPTIERVRQKIGSGSPNTVSPFLDTWFKHLGGRIKDPGAFAAPSGIPDPVQQAAKHFWETALAETRHDFDLRLQKGMSAAVENVEAEKDRASLAEAAAFEASSRVTHLQAEISHRAAELEAERLVRVTTQGDLANAKLVAEDLGSRLDRAEKAIASERARHRTDLEAAEQRSDGAQRRAALDIDLERQARAQADKRLSTSMTKLERVQGELEDERAQRTSSTKQLAGEVSALTRERDLLSTRVAEAESRLQEQSARLTVALTRADRAEAESALAQTLLNPPSKPATSKARKASSQIKPGRD